MSATDNHVVATKTRGLEKSIWIEFNQLALETNPLNLGEGFPDFAAPDTITKALAEICVDKKNVLFNQYTTGCGHPRLVAALSKLYSKLLNRELDGNNEILVTLGATEALFVTINGLVNAGDEVIIIEPFFDCYVPQVILAGGKPIFVPLRPMKTEGMVTSADWKLDLDELTSAFNSNTKAIVVNTPNNPVGKVYSKDELTVIADLCKKHNTYAIMDEVYEWMTYDGLEHIRMASLPGMWERCITIGSAGKTFSCTGWRTGWAIGPKELLAGPNVIHSHTISSICTPIQEALARGFEIEIARLDTPECYFRSLTLELKAKRDKIANILIKADMNPIIPEGGYFILADASKLMEKIDVGGDENECKGFRFVKWLSRNRKLQGIPTSAFFSDPHKSVGENYVRFCFIKEDHNLERAGEILEKLKSDVDAGKV